MQRRGWIAIGTVALGVALGHAVASVQASPGVTHVAQRPAASAVSAAAPGAPRGPIVVRTAAEAYAAAEQVAAAGRKPNILNYNTLRAGTPSSASARSRA
jgi:hypothetical protein